MTIEETVADDYAKAGLEQVILDALAASGKDLDHLVPDDLMPVDEFHVGGRKATADFVARLGLRAGMHLLDLGSGLGGPARYVAQTFGCRVTGIDLTPRFVQVATALSDRVGLGHRVGYVCGSAIATPFRSGGFDVACMISVGTNISDKAALFAEVRRLLKPGGVFGVYDVMRIGAGDLPYPVPWASHPSTSFLAPPQEYRRQLEAAGFVVRHERNRREEGLQFFRDMRTKAAAHGIPSLGLHLVMNDFAPKSINMFASMLREITAPIEMIAHRS